MRVNAARARRLTFNRAELVLSPVTRARIFTQALQQRLQLDLPHAPSVCLQLAPLPRAEPADHLDSHVLAEQAAKRPVVALHFRADVLPHERHPGQRAEADTGGGGCGRGGRHRCVGDSPRVFVTYASDPYESPSDQAGVLLGRGTAHRFPLTVERSPYLPKLSVTKATNTGKAAKEGHTTSPKPRTDIASG